MFRLIGSSVLFGVLFGSAVIQDSFLHLYKKWVPTNPGYIWEFFPENVVCLVFALWLCPEPVKPLKVLGYYLLSFTICFMIRMVFMMLSTMHKGPMMIN